MLQGPCRPGRWRSDGSQGAAGRADGGGRVAVCGLLLRRALSAAVSGPLADGAPTVAAGAILFLTYPNATAAVPLLLACGVAGWVLCRLVFVTGVSFVHVLWAPAVAGLPVKLVSGMSNVSVSAVMVVQAVPGEPTALLAALVYGFAQKVTARRVVQQGDVPTCARTRQSRRQCAGRPQR